MELPIKSVSLTAVEFLRDQIITNQLTPGQKLNEQDLSVSLNISRGPVREAFRVLEAENLLSNIPRKGTFVSEMSSNDFIEVLEARSMLELWVINLIRDKKIRNLDKIASSVETIDKRPVPNLGADANQKLSYLKCLVEFHKQIIRTAQNLRLIQFYERLSSSLLRYQYTYFYKIVHRRDRKRPGSEHKEILEALERQDYATANQLLKKHIEIAFEVGGKEQFIEKT